MDDQRGDTVDSLQERPSSLIRGSLMKLKASDVPEGAYWVNPSMVARYYREQINAWKPESEV